VFGLLSISPEFKFEESKIKLYMIRLKFNFDIEIRRVSIKRYYVKCNIKIRQPVGIL